MKRSPWLVPLAVVIGLASTADARAQVRQTRPAPSRRPVMTERGFISVDGLFQGGSNDFHDSSTFRLYAEDGNLNADYSVASGPAFDVWGGGLVWKNLVVGVGASRYSHSTPTEVSASLPHPFYFNQPRPVSGTYDGVRQEVAVHVQARVLFNPSRAVQVSLFGGPSFFHVTQDIVDDVDYAESYPFDTATFTSAVISNQSASALGVHVGGDFAYFFTDRVGVGAGVRYAGATVQMKTPSGTADVRAGGAQIGGGLRLRF